MFPFNYYGLDIETDTSALTNAEIAAGYTSRGLDPKISPIVNIAVSFKDDSIVFRSDKAGEAAMLLELNTWFKNASPGVIATWNGSVFDLPFISDRAKLLGVALDLSLDFDPSITPKYESLPGHLGGYSAWWRSISWVCHSHTDVAYQYKNFCEDNSISWSLKPCAKAFEMDPIEVDREKIHLLSKIEQDAYVSSDAYVTRMLAQRLWESVE